MKWTRSQLADFAAKAEKNIGTESGGMDQAICFLGQDNLAMRIGFSPLTCTPVQLRSDARFVIAHSRIQSLKAAQNYYNIRVLECRLACLFLLQASPSAAQPPEILTLRQVARLLELTPSAMLPRCATLPNDLSLAAAADQLHCSVEALLPIVPAQLQEAVHELSLFPKSRALHVYSETERVTEFCHAASQDDLEAMGRAMIGSHTSLRDDYACSHPALEELCSLSCQAGSTGARLTGAGWGGCSVHLVGGDAQAAALREVLQQQFYGNEDSDVSTSWLFEAKACQGCSAWFCGREEVKEVE